MVSYQQPLTTYICQDIYYNLHVSAHMLASLSLTSLTSVVHLCGVSQQYTGPIVQCLCWLFTASLALFCYQHIWHKRQNKQQTVNTVSNKTPNILPTYTTHMQTRNQLSWNWWQL